MLAPFLSAAPVDPAGREVVVAAGATVPEPPAPPELPPEPPEPPEPPDPEPPDPEPPPEPPELEPLLPVGALELVVLLPPVEGTVVRVVEFFGG